MQVIKKINSNKSNWNRKEDTEKEHVGGKVLGPDLDGLRCYGSSKNDDPPVYRSPPCGFWLESMRPFWGFMDVRVTPEGPTRWPRTPAEENRKQSSCCSCGVAQASRRRDSPIGLQTATLAATEQEVYDAVRSEEGKISFVCVSSQSENSSEIVFGSTIPLKVSKDSKNLKTGPETHVMLEMSVMQHIIGSSYYKTPQKAKEMSGIKCRDAGVSGQTGLRRLPDWSMTPQQQHGDTLGSSVRLSVSLCWTTWPTSIGWSLVPPARLKATKTCLLKSTGIKFSVSEERLKFILRHPEVYLLIKPWPSAK